MRYADWSVVREWRDPETGERSASKRHVRLVSGLYGRQTSARYDIPRVYGEDELFFLPHVIGVDVDAHCD